MGRERLSGETANRRHEKKREGQSMGGVMNSYRSVAEIEMDNSESGRGRGADRRGKRHIRAGARRAGDVSAHLCDRPLTAPEVREPQPTNKPS